MKIKSDSYAEGFYLKQGAQRVGEVPSTVQPDLLFPLLYLNRETHTDKESSTGKVWLLSATRVKRFIGRQINIQKGVLWVLSLWGSLLPECIQMWQTVTYIA